MKRKGVWFGILWILGLVIMVDLGSHFLHIPKTELLLWAIIGMFLGDRL